MVARRRWDCTLHQTPDPPLAPTPDSPSSAPAPDPLVTNTRPPTSNTPGLLLSTFLFPAETIGPALKGRDGQWCLYDPTPNPSQESYFQKKWPPGKRRSTGGPMKNPVSCSANTPPLLQWPLAQKYVPLSQNGCHQPSSFGCILTSKHQRCCSLVWKGFFVWIKAANV